MADNINDRVRGLAADLSSPAFESYMQQLKPYQHKVYEKRGLLTCPEVNALEAIRQDIEPFSGQNRQGIYGEICNILGLNSIREGYEQERLLTEERHQLMQLLQDMPPQEKIAAFNRLDDIGRILEPEHRYL
jgi:hypothetical protein